MDTSSGLYQMFGVLADVVLLPPRAAAVGATGTSAGAPAQEQRQEQPGCATAQYLEEVPTDLLDKLVALGQCAPVETSSCSGGSKDTLCMQGQQ
jgi:hypothetical protein